MGANQSSAGGDKNQPVGEVKTSYYELLGVERHATDDEIKKAYRRKALELHPDRNYGKEEEATRIFADIQVAYEILSDSQERAWYDSHESAILRGADPTDEHYEHDVKVTTADDIAVMMGKFNGKIEFSDAPGGFFGFLRETFETLAKEEENAAEWEALEVPEYPPFGHKDDEYEDVVKQFYAGWSGFATKKTFAWKDKFRLSEAPDRRYRRAMEKENKKMRDEAIREFNDAVRTLLLFVRRRDPRYTPNFQTEAQRQQALRDAAKAQAAKSRAAHAAKVAAQEVPAWAKSQEPEEDEESEDEEVEVDEFECVACNKTFKSERQFEAHEKSKKHQKAVQALKRKMKKEDDRIRREGGSDVEGDGIKLPTVEDGSDADEYGEIDDAELAESMEDLKVADDNSSASEVESLDETVGHSEDNVKSISEGVESASDSDEDDDDYAPRSEVTDRLQNPDESAIKDDEDDDADEKEDTTGPKKVGKAAQKRAKKAAKQAVADEEEMKHKCAVCNAAFPSRSRLFQHITDFGHAAPVQQKAAKSGKGGKKKK